MTKKEIFENYANELKANGFEVYVLADKENPNYGFIVKDDKIGYIQVGDFGGICFSTVHKPCKECGTGFGLSDNNNSIDRAEYYPTIAHAERTFIKAPHWAISSQCAVIKKYNNWDEYISKTTLKYSKY